MNTKSVTKQYNCAKAKKKTASLRQIKGIDSCSDYKYKLNKEISKPLFLILFLFKMAENPESLH